MMNFNIKLTKKCNLGCAYCFEQDYFNDPQVLTLSDMDLILHSIKTYCLNKRVGGVFITFTGGEVLTTGKKFLASLFELCAQIFKETPILVKLHIQTNLTLMDQGFADILKKYKVAVGCSFDVFGGQRKFKNGEVADSAIKAGMNVALKNDLLSGAIVVVTRANYEYASQIYDFYQRIPLKFDFIKFDPWINKYAPELVISDQEYIGFLKALADKYFEQEEPKVKVRQLDSYIELLKRGPGHGNLCYFSRRCRNLFIEHNGNMNPCESLRYRDLYLGNILREPLEEILNSPVLKKLDERYEFVKKECRSCKYLDLCNGGCMAFAHWEGNILGPSKSACAENRAMFEYIGNKLKERGQELYPLPT